MSNEGYQKTVLGNGICILTEEMPHAISASIGIWVRSGPRYEKPAQAGISHFLEHMFFKGTRNRTSKQINESLYPVGGHLNAFTDREFTCFTAVVLRDSIPLALEVLCDMLTNSVFAPAELTREKNVVLEEIKAIEDNPEDLITDVFNNTIWPDQPLGRPVIGQSETVATFTRDDLITYLVERFTPENIVVCAAGNLSHSELVKEVEGWLAALNGKTAPTEFSPPVPHNGLKVIYRKTEQAHVCMGMPSFRHADDDNYPLIILDTILGGGPHSRLFEEIRENRGLAYSIGSAINTYTEGGMFQVYASTSAGSLSTVIDIVRAELARAAKEPLTEEELDLAKRHLRASLLLAHEGTGSRMGRLAHSHLYFGRLIPFSEILARLDAVTTEDILRIARKVFQTGSVAMAVIGPIRPGSKQAEKLLAA